MIHKCSSGSVNSPGISEPNRVTTGQVARLAITR